MWWDERRRGDRILACLMLLVCLTLAGCGPRLPQIREWQEAGAVKPLIAALGDWDVRESAVEALGELGEPAVELLIAALKDENWLVRDGAADALGEIKDTRAVEPLIVALKDGSVRYEAAVALGKIGDARAVEPLIAALKYEYWVLYRHRYDEASREAYTIETPVWAFYLWDAWEARFETWNLKDRGWHVRAAAAAALGEIGDARAEEPLIVALKDDDSGARWATACVLEEVRKLAGEPSYPSLWLENETWHVRAAAAAALGKIGDGRAVEPLTVALKDDNVYVRGRAALALGEDSKAVETLIAALKDKDGDVRGKAAEALGELKDSMAVEPLIAAMKDERGYVRESAVEALGEIGDARAVEPLIAGLRDESWYIRAAAAEALGKIGDAKAIRPLEDLAQNDPHSHVRQAAEDALAKIRGK